MFVSFLCSAETKHGNKSIQKKHARNDQGKQYLHAVYALSSLVTNLNVIEILKPIQGWFSAVTRSSEKPQMFC